MISVKIKWSGSEYPLEQIPLSTTVKELKDLIKEHTGVLPVRQKLCGISLKGKDFIKVRMKCLYCLKRVFTICSYCAGIVIVNCFSFVVNKIKLIKS